MLTILAINMTSGFIAALVWIIIAALFFFIGKWAIGYIGVEEPFLKICKVVLVIGVIVFLLNAVFVLVGHPFISW